MQRSNPKRLRLLPFGKPLAPKGALRKRVYIPLRSIRNDIVLTQAIRNRGYTNKVRLRGLNNKGGIRSGFGMSAITGGGGFRIAIATFLD
ncbi:hypothetical protein HW132_05965 [Brasilonema sp. CT11]|nr:hypothetical protein [Brasilonema sp. CT11]